jgi:hypothetical protein
MAANTGIRLLPKNLSDSDRALWLAGYEAAINAMEAQNTVHNISVMPCVGCLNKITTCRLGYQIEDQPCNQRTAQH